MLTSESMTTVLSSNELGEAGEAAFKNQCARAQLVCNKSDRDLTGWDFIVEFPMAAPARGLALDQRAPKSCVVQLKSTSKSGNSVSVRLSAVERLAKDPKPAVLVVFRLRPNGDFIEGFAVHLIGNELGRILKRLRQAEADGKFDVNRTRISFDYRQSGAQFDPTPEGLKAALEDICGSNVEAYIAEKQRQLSELGYEDGGLLANVSFQVRDSDHLSDVLLGLEPIRPVKVRAFSTRFGIALPYTGELFSEIAELRLTPRESGTGQIIVRSNLPGLRQPAVFPADFYLSPIDQDFPSFALKHPDLTVVVRDGKLNFSTIGDIRTVELPLARWQELARGLTYLISGSASISIVLNLHQQAELSMPVREPIDGPYVDQMPRISQFLDGWAQTLAIAGVRSEVPFGLDAVWDGISAAIAADILTAETKLTNFALEMESDSGVSGSVDALFFRNCSFAGANISYAAKVTLVPVEEGSRSYRSSLFTPLDARPQVSDLAEYGTSQAAAHGIRILLDPTGNLVDSSPDNAG